MRETDRKSSFKKSLYHFFLAADKGTKRAWQQICVIVKQVFPTKNDNGIQRGKNKKKRCHICFRSEIEFAKRIFSGVAAAICIAAIVVSGYKIINYYADKKSTEITSEEFREVYYSETEIPSSSTITPTASSALSAAQITYSPEPSPVPESCLYLPKKSYPGNPYNLVQKRFENLRGANKDIIGWLSVNDVIDEPVVQRDNKYYLTHDYRGYHNENGAIFMEETIDLKSRPYTIMLYGHNMKSGAMFGSLHNYDNLSFYKAHPFITFDTKYENGTYVVFSVCTLSIDTNRFGSVSFGRLMSDNCSIRDKEIQNLRYKSLFSVDINVQSDDQILLLITCAKNDDTRRIIAARRLREDETVEFLQKQINHSYKK